MRNAENKKGLSKNTKMRIFTLVSLVLLIMLALCTLYIWYGAPVEATAKPHALPAPIVEAGPKTDGEPPLLTLASLTRVMGEEFSVESFITASKDDSAIAYIAFFEEPDPFMAGEQPIFIVAEDVHGNAAVYETSLHLMVPDIPPIIEGVREMIEWPQYKAVQLRQGISAHDAFGRELTVHVDTGELNIDETGLYAVTYYVEDDWGGQAEATALVRIIDADPEEVERRVDAILEGLLHDDMTQAEEARAIFDWIRNNVEYMGSVGQESVYEAAFQALQHRRGNCYVFYAISELMLERAGIPNMRIDRVPEASRRHRWNLINPDDTGWHHFDTTVGFFLFGDAQAARNAAYLATLGNPENYYEYDPELYPPVEP